MERDYFDAKFAGLEKLIEAHKDNTDAHISAVSKNATKALDALSEHKEDAGAHGVKSSRSAISEVVAWIGLAVGAVLGLLEYGRHRGP